MEQTDCSRGGGLSLKNMIARSGAEEQGEKTKDEVRGGQRASAPAQRKRTLKREAKRPGRLGGGRRVQSGEEKQDMKTVRRENWSELCLTCAPSSLQTFSFPKPCVSDPTSSWYGEPGSGARHSFKPL